MAKKKKTVTGKWRVSKTKPTRSKNWKRCVWHKQWVAPHSFSNCRCRGCPFHG